MQAVQLNTAIQSNPNNMSKMQANAKFGHGPIPDPITSVSGMGEAALFGIILSAGIAAGTYLINAASYGISSLWNSSKKEA